MIYLTHIVANDVDTGHIIIIEVVLEEVAWEVLSTILFDRPFCPSNFHLFGLPKDLI
jgi:hypothetical protein